jgi:hypothetical protein
MTYVLHAFVTTLLSSTPGVHLDKVTVARGAVRLQLTATAPHARCPCCVVPSARRTHRLTTVLRAIGIALGGQAGARLAARLRLPASPATLLRLVRATPVPATPALQATKLVIITWVCAILGEGR